MKIILNNGIIILNGTAIADLIVQTSPQKPFAVTVNTQFVVEGTYVKTVLNENDRADTMHPVVGG